MNTENSPISWKQLIIAVPLLAVVVSMAGGYFTLYGQIALIQQRLDTIISANAVANDKADKTETKIIDHEIRLDRLERKSQ